jgi:hypothetical protein
VLVLNLEVKNALSTTEEILSILRKERVANKIVIIKVHGILEAGKSSDIDFVKIENYLRKENVYAMLKSTSKLQLYEGEIKIDILDSTQFETEIIKKFEEANPSKFNQWITSLVKVLQLDKIEDEKLFIFEERLISETKKILPI